MPDAKPPPFPIEPISWAPSQYWDGVDGDWSSFDIRVGFPEQTVRVLPSTAGSATWVVIPGGCESLSSNCNDARGGLLNQSRSNTWQDLGPFTLALEQNLGHNESGAYGRDTIALGLSEATGGPTLHSQIVAGIETEHWYTGVFGLQQLPINLTSFSQPRQSFLSALRASNLIPSLSWSYTAGAHYRMKPWQRMIPGVEVNEYLCLTTFAELALSDAHVARSKGIFGSLTLGGSDTSKYVPTNISFTLSRDVARDLVVGIQSITSTYINGSRMTTVSKPTVDITLPYASFDIIIKPPLLPNATSYFPLRRGLENQITLGRAFLQEAYLIIDYDNNNFTVAQTLFDDSAKSNIVPIPWNATAVPRSDVPLNVTAVSRSDGKLSRQAAIGISTSSTICVILALALIVFLISRRRKHRAMTKLTDPGMRLDYSPKVKPFSLISIQEIGHQSVRELHGMPYQIELLDEQTPSGSGNNISELPDARATPYPELLTPAKSRDDPKELSSGQVAALPKAKSRAIDSGPSRARLTRDDSRLRRGSTRPPTSRFSHRRPQTNANKALPRVPLAKGQPNRPHSSVRSLSATPIFEGVRMPLSSYEIAGDPFLEESMSVVVNNRLSQNSRYATVFDVGEYKDDAFVNKR